eukprot:1153480-Pelagomonas_calceolata.AAC.2
MALHELLPMQLHVPLEVLHNHPLRALNVLMQGCVGGHALPACKRAASKACSTKRGLMQRLTPCLLQQGVCHGAGLLEEGLGVCRSPVKCTDFTASPSDYHSSGHEYVLAI